MGTLGFVILIVSVAAVSFALGILVGRNNKALVEKYVEQFKPQFEAVVKEISDLKEKIDKK